MNDVGILWIWYLNNLALGDLPHTLAEDPENPEEILAAKADGDVTVSDAHETDSLKGVANNPSAPRECVESAPSNVISFVKAPVYANAKEEGSRSTSGLRSLPMLPLTNCIN